MRVHSCSHGCRLLCIIPPYVSAHCSDLLPLQAKERMTKSTVVDSATGKSMDSDVRTSTGSFYSRGQDEVRQSWVDGCCMFGCGRRGGQEAGGLAAFCACQQH